MVSEGADSNWEGAFRVPELIRWPGKIEAGTVSNEIVQHHDWLPTFLAAAGEPEIVEKLKAGHQIGDRTSRCTSTGTTWCRTSPARWTRSPRPGVGLLLGRAAATCRASVRQLEGRVHGAAGGRDASDLGRTVRAASRPEAVQPAHRPVRARRRDLEHLLRLDPRQRLYRVGRGPPWPRSSSRRSRSSRRGRRRRASRSTRSFKKLEEALASGGPDLAGPLASWNDTGRRARRSITLLAETAGARPSRPRSGSRSSTTTARWCRHRCRSSSASSSSGWPRWPSGTNRSAASQPWQAAYEKDYAWLGGVFEKHYAGDDTEVKVLLGGMLQAFAGQTVDEYAATAAAFLRARPAPDPGPPPARLRVRPHGRVASLPRVARLHLVHRLRRQPRLHADGHPRAVRDPAATRDRQLERAAVHG